MALDVIGAGVGRTGTYSLKLALEALGFGPCHHMEEVLLDPGRQVPLWQGALEAAGEDAGAPARSADGDAADARAGSGVDWDRVFEGYRSAVDWPTAAFWPELAAAYPEARIVLSTRAAEGWAESFAATIQALLGAADQIPPRMRDWFAMATGVVARSGFAPGIEREALAEGFEAHGRAVEAGVAAGRLLVFDVREGWAPLCAFLGVEEPDAPFPRSNHRTEFWDRVAAAG